MLKSISFKKLAVLTAGLAIVLSSCGLQNSASESSGTETAAGKTKNSALGEWCYNDEVGSPMDLDEKVGFLTKRQWADFGHARYKWQDKKTWLTDAYGPSIVPCSWTNYGSDKPAEIPAEIQLFDSENAAGFSGPPPARVVAACVKPDLKQKMIDGYTEQLARPLGGEVTEAYLAEMQKGLDVTNGMCTN